MAISQDSHLALNMGPSFPIGDYSLSDEYKTTGFANPGFVLSFEGNYIPTWYFGIGGELTFGTSYPNQDSMLSALIKEIGTIDEIPAIPEGVESNFITENWSYVNFLVGPTFAYPAGKLQLNFKALIGISVIMPPTQELIVKYDNSEIAVNSDVQDARFCYNLGANIILKLSGNYSLKLGAEYFSTKTLHEVNIAYNDNSLPAIERNITLQSLHTTLGLAYLF